MLAAHVADIPVLDLGLPDIDGLEVVQAAHSDGRLPVVVLTAHGGVDDRIRGLELGAEDYVTKTCSATPAATRARATR
jgi:two-component system alkaline phosphatase synthesis response regulator PhoP